MVKHENPALEVTRVKTSAWLLGAAFPSSPYIAAAAAGATVVRLFVGRRWGHALWLAVAFIAAFRLLAGANVPARHRDRGRASAGSSAPPRPWCSALPTIGPTAHEVAESLAGCGLPVARLVPAAVDARGSTPWFATTTDGSPLFVKALGRDERDADLLFRIYRFFRLKNVGDQRPFSSLRRAVEHEALVALKARDSGIRTPRVRNVATVGPDGMLLAYDAIEGTSIDSITEYDDDLLEQIWQQVAILRRERIAHRDLRRANIFRGTDGELWIIDFGFSELAASDQLLRADVAELLAATAIVVGPERAVRAAVGVLGKEPVGDSLAMLQPLALAGATHKAMAEQKGLMAGLQAEVRATDGGHGRPARAAGPGAPAHGPDPGLQPDRPLRAHPPADRRGRDGAPAAATPAGDGWARRCSSRSSATSAPASASWASRRPTCPRSTRSRSACPGPSSTASPPPAWAASGSTCATCRSGVRDTAVAASRIGVNSVLGLVIHLTLTLLFVLWAGKEASFDFRLPKMPLLVGLLVVLVGAGRGLPGAVGPRAPAGLGPPGARPGLVRRDHDRQAAVAPARHDHRRHLDHPLLPVRPLLRGGGLRGRVGLPGRRARSTWPARPSARRRRRRAAWARSRRR